MENYITPPYQSQIIGVNALSSREFQGNDDDTVKKAIARRTAYIKSVDAAKNMRGMGKVLRKAAEGLANQIDEEDRRK